MKLSLTTRLLVAVLTLFTTSCSNEEALAQTTSDMKINITIGDQTRTATLVSNSSTEALVAALREAPITYEAHDYGNFEKVGDLGRSFPQNNTQTTTEPGDLILYQDLFESYARTKTTDYQVASIMLTFNLCPAKIFCDNYETPLPIVWIRDVIENPMLVFDYGNYS